MTKPKRMQLANAERAIALMKRIDPPKIVKLGRVSCAEIPDVEYVRRTPKAVVMRIYGFEQYIPLYAVLMPDNGFMYDGWTGTFRISEAFALRAGLV